MKELNVYDLFEFEKDEQELYRAKIAIGKLQNDELILTNKRIIIIDVKKNWFKIEGETRLYSLSSIAKINGKPNITANGNTINIVLNDGNLNFKFLSGSPEELITIIQKATETFWQKIMNNDQVQDAVKAAAGAAFS